ncbi:MAG TPA: FAD-binding oxidoreductase [Vicinamibacterales bacterium]
MATDSQAIVRAGGPSDAVDGVVPRQVVEPESHAGLAAAMAAASRDRLATVLRGGGTKIDWGRPPLAIDLAISTSRLNTLIVHRHGDLTATAHAGVTLKQLNQELARYGQWLPIDSAFDGATIGGIVASGDAGPLRHRYGTPRDLLIGVNLAMTDGRVVKAGGHVVKNVAGYDLGKLISGSFGSLAAIADATFKLLPMPKASATLVASYDDGERLGRDAQTIMASQVEPIAFDVRIASGADAAALAYVLLVRIASSPSAVEAQIESAQRLLASPSRLVRDDAEESLWREQVRGPWAESGAVVRVAWLPAKLTEVVTLVHEVQKMAAGRVGAWGRVGAGAGLMTIDGDALTQAAVVRRLRSSVFVGNVTVLRASRELKSQIDVWSLSGGAVKTLHALKQTFDPAGILNAGRGPI